MKRCAGTLISITQKLMYIRSFLPLVTDVEVSRLPSLTVTHVHYCRPEFCHQRP